MSRAADSFPRIFLGTLLPVLVIGAGCRGCGEDVPAGVPAASAQAPAPADEPDEAIDALNPALPRQPDLAPNPLTMNGDPNGPKQEEFDRIHAKGQSDVQACLDKMPPTVVLPNGAARLNIRYDVGSDGKTREVSVTGDLPAETVACGKAALDALVFPVFQGPGIRNAFSLTYNRGPQANPAPAK